MEEKKDKGITAKKEENFSEWYSQVCGEQGAKLADLRYDVQGFIVHRPWAFKILKKIYEFFEKQVEEDNHDPMLFPTVIPEEHLMKEKEHAGFTPEVFWIEYAGDKKLERRLALRPTGETQIYPLYSLWIRSYNDLPFKAYQSRITTFRNEMTTRPFIRGREFMFFETHDVFRTHGDALKQIKTDMETMQIVAKEKLKIPFIFLKRPKWDTFKGADDTYASDTLLPDGRRMQIGTTHDLGHNFAKAFNIQFKDEKGEEKYAWQTCFGPGIWRIFASIVSIHGDNKGLILPFEIAPIQAIIVPITFIKDPEKSKEVIKLAKQLEKKLNKWKIRAKIDASENTPGYKFNQWEMLGVPIRIEIGPKEAQEKKATIALRNKKEKAIVDLNELKKKIKELGQEANTIIQQQAEKYFADNTKTAKTFEELKKIIETHRGFVKIPFCNTNNEGKQCAGVIKSELNGVDICGTPLENPEQPNKDDKCIVCNKEATSIVYAAKSV